jgi:aminopeptidase N
MSFSHASSTPLTRAQRAALWLVVAVGCKASSVEPATPNFECGEASVVDVVSHRIELTTTDAARSVTGRGEVVVRILEPTDSVMLDAHALHVTHVSEKHSLRFKQTPTSVCIALPQVAAAGEAVALKLSWKITHSAKTPHVGNDQIWAGYDAAAWMPTRQDSAQRATLDLTIVAPRDWKVVGPGHRVASGPSMSVASLSLQSATAASADLGSNRFEVSRPSPPFLFAFAAGTFAEAELDVDGVRLRALGPPGSNLDEALAITARMLRFLVRRTGTAPPNDEYTQVFVEGEAAQEAAGFALLSAAALDDLKLDPQNDWIFLHELAHQWFGWQVACADFNDFWLNEGFATFLTGAYKEERWGPAAHARELRLWLEGSAKAHRESRDAPLSRSLPGRAPLPSPSDSELPARGVTYARGALVLQKLREQLGEEKFWAGIRAYVAARSWKSARTDDLRSALEAASGDDLRLFFERWVYASASDF